MNPEEITNVSMTDKLAQFEAKLAQYDIAIADVKRTNYAIDARVSNMENSRNAEWPNIISTVVPDKNGKQVTRDDNPFIVLNRDATGSENSGTSGNGPRHVEYKRHARVGNDRRNELMIQLVTTTMVDEDIIDVIVQIVMSVMMVEKQELRHHVVYLHNCIWRRSRIRT